VVPRSGMARARWLSSKVASVFGFLAGVIGYLPFIYGSFSKRGSQHFSAGFASRHSRRPPANFFAATATRMDKKRCVSC